MNYINIHEAKTHFSKLLQQVAVGEEVVIARSGVPIAKIVPMPSQHEKRPLGLCAGQFTVLDDFNDPLPDDILAGFNGD